VARLAAALCLAFAFVTSALAAGPWDGTYLYEQGLGKGAGGISLFVTHTLTIDGSQCRLTAEGYQTDEHIRCKAAADGDKLEVAFVSFRGGAMLNRFGVREYTANQPLFTLTRKGDAIATTWQGYNRNTIDTAGPPTFRKPAR
jgi:alpha-acetolactate decarboxylase